MTERIKTSRKQIIKTTKRKTDLTMKKYQDENETETISFRKPTHANVKTENP